MFKKLDKLKNPRAVSHKSSFRLLKLCFNLGFKRMIKDLDGIRLKFRLKYLYFLPNVCNLVTKKNNKLDKNTMRIIPERGTILVMGALAGLYFFLNKLYSLYYFKKQEIITRCNVTASTDPHNGSKFNRPSEFFFLSTYLRHSENNTN